MNKLLSITISNMKKTNENQCMIFGIVLADSNKK